MWQQLSYLHDLLIFFYLGAARVALKAGFAGHETPKEWGFEDITWRPILE
jgi:hypothetical protein